MRRARRAVDAHRPFAVGFVGHTTKPSHRLRRCLCSPIGLGDRAARTGSRQLEAGVRTRRRRGADRPGRGGQDTLARAAAERLGARTSPRVDWVTATASAAALCRSRRSSDLHRRSRHRQDGGGPAGGARVARRRPAAGRRRRAPLDKLSAALVYQLAVSGTDAIAHRGGRVRRACARRDFDALWSDDLRDPDRAATAGHDDSRLTTRSTSSSQALPAARIGCWSTWPSTDRCPSPRCPSWRVRDAVAEAASAGAVVVDGDRVRPAHPLFVDARARRDWAARNCAGCAPSSSRGSPAATRRRRARCGSRCWRWQPTVRSRSPNWSARPRTPCGSAIWSSASASAGPRCNARPDLAARLTLAYALAWQGRGRDADAVLADVDPATLSEAELMAWALPTAANQFWMLSEPERATAFLQATRNRVATPAARTTLDALSATFAMNAGNPGRAMQIADEVLASPTADDTAVGWAAAAAALSSARMGLFADVDALAERAMAAGHPGLLRFTSGFGQTTALVMAGELDRAQALAQQLTDFAQRQQPGRAIGEVLGGRRADRQGRSASRRWRLLRRAAAALAPTGYSWGPLAWMLLAQALGQQGADGRGGKGVGPGGIPAWPEVDAVRAGAGAGARVDDVRARRRPRRDRRGAGSGTRRRAWRPVGGRAAGAARRGSTRRHIARPTASRGQCRTSIAWWARSRRRMPAPWQPVMHPNCVTWQSGWRPSA